MKSPLAPLLIAAALLVGGSAFADGKAADAAAAGLSPLARKYAVKREALLKEFSAKRRALIGSPGWKSLSPERQKAALDELESKLKARDAKLAAEYDAERRRQSAQKDADEESARQARQRELDEIKAHAAQDALRAKKAP